MSEPGPGENLPLLTEVETFIESESFRNVFKDLADKHIAHLKKVNEAVDKHNQRPEAMQAIYRFSELSGDISEGFPEYEIDTPPDFGENHDSFRIVLINAKDLKAKNSAKDNIGQNNAPRQQMVIFLEKKEGYDVFGKSPQDVLDSRGMTMTIQKKLIWGGENEVKAWTSECGLKVNLAASGESRGFATKYDGRYAYYSKPYDVGADMNQHVTDLLNRCQNLCKHQG